MKRSLIAALLTTFALFFTSCGNGTGTNIQIPGLSGPTVTLESENILIDMVFEKIQLEGSLTYAIPKLADSYVALSPDEATGGIHMLFTININGLLQGYGTTIDPLTLPGGRALPGVASGSLPAMAFTIEKFENITFYIGTEVFGFFVPFNTGFDNNIATFRYYIKGNRGGNISLVGRDTAGANSGILLLLDFGSTTKKLLKKYMKKM